MVRYTLWSTSRVTGNGPVHFVVHFQRHWQNAISTHIHKVLVHFQRHWQHVISDYITQTMIH